MKKFGLIIISMLALCVTTANAGNDRIITVEQLPATAQQFVKKHFSSKDITIVKMDKELMSTDYEIMFSNGTKIDFDGKGNWESVECKTSAVPAGIVPAQIRDYVKKNYPKESVKKIEKDRKGYEVELSNKLELSFDSKFRLVDIDM